MGSSYSQSENVWDWILSIVSLRKRSALKAGMRTEMRGVGCMRLGICRNSLCDFAARSDYLGAFVGRGRFHHRHLPSRSAGRQSGNSAESLYSSPPFAFLPFSPPHRLPSDGKSNSLLALFSCEIFKVETLLLKTVNREHFRRDREGDRLCIRVLRCGPIQPDRIGSRLGVCA